MLLEALPDDLIHLIWYIIYLINAINRRKNGYHKWVNLACNIVQVVHMYQGLLYGDCEF